MCKRAQYLHNSRKSVPLQRVFHSIRFKVNKGWSSAELLFLCLFLGYFSCIYSDFKLFTGLLRAVR